MTSREMINRVLAFKINLIAYGELKDSIKSQINLDVTLEINDELMKKENNQYINQFIRTYLEEMMAEYTESNDKFYALSNPVSDCLGMSIIQDDFNKLLNIVSKYNQDNKRNKITDVNNNLSINIVVDSGEYRTITVDLEKKHELDINDIPNFIKDRKQCLDSINGHLNKIKAYMVLNHLGK